MSTFIGELRRSLATLLLLGMVALGGGGCAAAGLVALGDRSVERTMPSDLSTTWGATVDALSRMAVRVEETDKSGDRWRLTGSGEAVTVHATLERITARLTKVSMRVEPGGLVADRRTGEELLNQVAASVSSLVDNGRPDTSAQTAAAGERLGALQREVEHLSAKIDQGQNSGSHPIETKQPPVPVLSVDPIIMVPASAGVATMPRPGPSVVRPPALSAKRSTPGPEKNLPRPGAAEQASVEADDMVAVPLRAVEVLTPVRGLTSREPLE
jgi:hypothetical protein